MIITKERKKQLYAHFKRQTSEISHEKTCTCAMLKLGKDKQWKEENIGSGHHQTSGDERKKSTSEEWESRRNLIKRVNTWAVHLVRYSGLFLK